MEDGGNPPSPRGYGAAGQPSRCFHFESSSPLKHGLAFKNRRRSRIVHLFDRIFAPQGKFRVSRASVLDCGGRRSATPLSEPQ